jgi:hypothetical protein
VGIHKTHSIIRSILPQRLKIISPAHKRNEGRAPVWGSEVTIKVAPKEGGGSAEFDSKLKRNFRDLIQWW